MWKYYKEKSEPGYLMAKTMSRKPRRHNLLDAVAADEPGDVRTVQYDMVTPQYLQIDCEPVDERDVPEDWKRALREAAGL
ncbi:MAG: hypothetical protein GWN84_05290 [Gammaproteobacteria bacterium]|nr:hypothetical protein [Gammaproteobacteria bacterium]NIR82376.1 hypothetical protein [Gammaproteobacteria bacterium]NIU03521.1 hypothetical protein [Gammaproteobacteria bacterium]NIX84795.1 hypothetical protein [Gammaproteobacteria bacterium]